MSSGSASRPSAPAVARWMETTFNMEHLLKKEPQPSTAAHAADVLNWMGVITNPLFFPHFPGGFVIRAGRTGGIAGTPDSRSELLPACTTLRNPLSPEF